MSNPQPAITTEDEFQRALSDLCQTARANGVDIRGGWRIDCEDGGVRHSLEIYRVAEADD